MPLRFLHATAALLAAAAALCTAGAQLPPQDALAKLQPAEGLEVTLFAAEPDLLNPTAMDIDARGRVWVTEAVNYRLFNQPATSAGGDRIRVLEDTDGDGHCDTATTFYQDPSLQAPIGIAVLGDRVYVCQSPDLFYLRDTNADGVADEKVVVLTGFGGVDHDHAIHGIMFGPDGLLYMSNGDRGLDVTDKSGHRIHAGPGAPVPAATVLRTDLEGTNLELLAWNMRNPYEPTVDSFGTVYISDNDDDGNEQTRINYIMEGGNYGYKPGRKGDRRLDAVHWNEDRPGTVPKMIKTGFGSPTGLLFYEGTALPERLRRTLIHADAGPGVIRSYRPAAAGAGYSAEQEVVLSAPEDKWFRPSDVVAAPDGSIFVADWYDPGVGGHRMEDVAQGRIYRVAAQGVPLSVPALDLETPEGLREAFASPNIARHYLAYAALDARLKAGDTALLEAWWAGTDPVLRARALWLFARVPGSGLVALGTAGTSEDPSFRILAVRIAASLGLESLRLFERLLDDPDPAVRRQILVEIAGDTVQGNWPHDWAMALARKFDGADRFYREAVGIAFRGIEADAFEDLALLFEHKWEAPLAGLAFQLHPIEALGSATQALNDAGMAMPLRELALQTIDAIHAPESAKIIADQVAADRPVELTQLALHLLARDEGDAWREELKTFPFDDQLRAMTAQPALNDAVRAFAAETGRPAFLPELLAAAGDATQPIEARVAAFEAIQRIGSKSQSRPGGALESLTAWLREDGRAGVEALNTIAVYRDKAAVDTVKTVIADESYPVGLRKRAAHGLAESRTGALALLALAEEGRVPADVLLDAAELLRESRYDDVRMMAGQVLPRDTTSAGTALPSVAELAAIPGDPANGRAVFFSEDRSQCYRCHRIGEEGRVVGPDLSTIGAKYGRDGLLESILNPSAAISHEYQVWVIGTEADGLLSGFIQAETPEAIDLMESNGEVRKIPTANILERYTSKTSLMPTGLAAGMTAQELSDVVAFLAALK